MSQSENIFPALHRQARRMQMQLGSLTTRSRLDAPDVWQFRWSEKSSQGRRVYRKRIIGTIEQYPNAEAARSAVYSLITEVNWANLRTNSIAMTVAQLCSHSSNVNLPKAILGAATRRRKLMLFICADGSFLIGEDINFARSEPLRWSPGCGDYRLLRAVAQKSAA